MFTHPIVAFDGSPLSRLALAKGVEVAKRLAIPLRAVIVDEGTRPSLVAGLAWTSDARVIEDEVDREANWARSLSEEAMTTALGAGVTISIDIVEGDAVEAIANTVERHGCDLLIIGLHHHPGLIERLTSRTGHDLSERVGCSVLGVR